MSTRDTKVRNGVHGFTASALNGGSLLQSQGGSSTECGREKLAKKPLRLSDADDSRLNESSDCIDDDGESTVADRTRNAREAVRNRQPLRAFESRAIREQSRAVPTDQRHLRPTVGRKELRQIVPLTASTIYELERRGAFPQRFFLARAA